MKEIEKMEAELVSRLKKVRKLKAKRNEVKTQIQKLAKNEKLLRFLRLLEETGIDEESRPQVVGRNGGLIKQLARLMQRRINIKEGDYTVKPIEIKWYIRMMNKAEQLFQTYYSIQDEIEVEYKSINRLAYTIKKLKGEIHD